MRHTQVVANEGSFAEGFPLAYTVKRHTVFCHPAIVGFDVHSHQVGHPLGNEADFFSGGELALCRIVQAGRDGLSAAFSHGDLLLRENRCAGDLLRSPLRFTQQLQQPAAMLRGYLLKKGNGREIWLKMTLCIAVRPNGFRGNADGGSNDALSLRPGTVKRVVQCSSTQTCLQRQSTKRPPSFTNGRDDIRPVPIGGIFNSSDVFIP